MILLDISIGLILLYFLYALLASIIMEIISSFLSLRARLLRQGIFNLLDDQNGGKWQHDLIKWWKDLMAIEPNDFIFTKAHQFYQQASIKYMAKPGDTAIYSIKNTKPSYITDKNFSNTLIDMLSNKGQGSTLWEKVQFSIETNSMNFEADTLSHIRAMLNRANGEFALFELELRHTFNEMMDRVNGWYKRKIKRILFLVGIVLVSTMNVDTLEIVKKLSVDKASRDHVVELAYTISDSSSQEAKILQSLDDTSMKTELWAKAYQSTMSSISEAHSVMGLGWKDEGFSFHQLTLSKMFGLLITILAISLGAQFWFDLLRKLVAIRNSGVKPEEKQTNSSQLSITQLKPNTGDYPLSSNPTDIAFYSNRKKWEEMPGVVAVNKVNLINNGKHEEYIEITEQETTNNIYGTIPNVTLKVIKGSLGQMSISYQDATMNSIYQPATGAAGTATGIVMNKRTGRPAILSCGHVLRSDASGYIKDGAKQIQFKNNVDTPKILGDLCNLNLSNFFDAGIIDTTLSKSELIQLGLNQIERFRTVTPNDVTNETEVIIKKLSGDIRAKIYFDSKGYKMTDGTQLYKMYDLLWIGNTDQTNFVPLTMPGDSGSLIVDMQGNAMGIHIAACKFEGRPYSLAVKISDVFDAFHLQSI